MFCRSRHFQKLREHLPPTPKCFIRLWCKYQNELFFFLRTYKGLIFIRPWDRKIKSADCIKMSTLTGWNTEKNNINNLSFHMQQGNCYNSSMTRFCETVGTDKEHSQINKHKFIKHKHKIMRQVHTTTSTQTSIAKQLIM